MSTFRRLQVTLIYAPFVPWYFVMHVIIDVSTAQWQVFIQAYQPFGRVTTFNSQWYRPGPTRIYLDIISQWFTAF